MDGDYIWCNHLDATEITAQQIIELSYLIQTLVLPWINDQFQSLSPGQRTFPAAPVPIYI